MKERWNKLFVGLAEILFSFWIVLTGGFVQPLLVNTSPHPLIGGFIYSFGTAVGAVYFGAAGLIDSGIITNNGNSKT